MLKQQQKTYHKLKLFLCIQIKFSFTKVFTRILELNQQISQKAQIISFPLKFVQSQNILFYGFGSFAFIAESTKKMKWNNYKELGSVRSNIYSSKGKKNPTREHFKRGQINMQSLE